MLSEKRGKNTTFFSALKLFEHLFFLIIFKIGKSGTNGCTVFCIRRDMESYSVEAFQFIENFFYTEAFE